MPVVEFPELEQYKAQGYKGTFVGGCVERGDGSSFRAKAHAHNEPYIKVGSSIVKDKQGDTKPDPYFGWICVRSAKRLYTRPGQPSNLMLHELCHILTPGHSHDDFWRKKAREYGVYIGKQYKKKERKDMTVAEKEIVGKEDALVKMQAVIGDADAKHMGIAKDGGEWFKNPKTGALYRVDKSEDGYEVKETKQSDQNNMHKTTTTGPSRKELMEEAKAKKIKYFRIMNKSELGEVIATGCSTKRIIEIQTAAVKRWKK